MTFDDILAQVLELLQRQGRVSYRALKRRFDIDDDYIEDLKEEILYVHPVRDDEGRGLVWAGEKASASAQGSDIHVMLALRRRSRQIVVTDEELNGPDMVSELLGKGQRVANQP
jgi:hypothetical protein